MHVVLAATIATWWNVATILALTTIWYAYPYLQDSCVSMIEK